MNNRNPLEVSGNAAMSQAVLLEDSLNPFLNDIDGYERFQRTAPAAKGAIGPHIWADNPRKPGAGKTYLPIVLHLYEFPKMLYRPRVNFSQQFSEMLGAIIKQTNKEKVQEGWEAFLDRLLESNLEIDFRQFSLPAKAPDLTALRMLKRTLILNIQAAEAASWMASNKNKSHEDFKHFQRTPDHTTVESAEAQKALGPGWFTSPACTPESEINKAA